MSRALSRSISISNCSEPLQHRGIIMCPAHARLTLLIASVRTPSTSCPSSSPRCKCRRGMSEQPCPRGNNARKSAVWLAGGRGVSSRTRRGKTPQEDEKVIHSQAFKLLLAETQHPAAEAGPSPREKAMAFIMIVPEAVLLTDDDNDFQVAFSFSIWFHDTDSPWVLQDQ
jgi:hypothetical protein